ncbi:hypothetical protein EMIHUDRAFT_201838 [Emiliania huxleyi CCMP1516]|uniref:Monogalactosyldiacylglycerol synthase n=2 Tax=Emiliania huxleyi TaxID=2903 RepID=A0A0D3KEK7_EMIH1|nr:hypothetical protein EMIHUDRAFT_201838 [Emiliania huxleyi CCMP1516]EOD34192.1 hypothetical protein EMIHUDRAFT_201838 [Emiliania huxleyi CCMP1516]|eukprot:XP_005786621.1 hypothetical protein EMIHUDRAFT_201838 [Emiliania huxleyi CCMP1516]
MPRRILFAAGHGGGGHKASARAVLDSLPRSLSDSDVVETFDIGYTVEACVWGLKEPRASGFDGDEVYNLLLRHGWMVTAGFLGLFVRVFTYLFRSRIVGGLVRLWSEAPPDLIVSFVPFFNSHMRDALETVNPNATLITVVTDFASSAEHPWVDERRRGGAHGELAQPEEEERDEPEEDACGALLGRPQEPRRALVSFGAMPPMRVEAVVDALKRRWPALEVRDHMRRTDMVIGKPGPGTVSEALASGAAFVSERRGVMAQEKKVLEWVEEVGAGVVVDDLSSPPADLCEAVRRCHPTVRARAEANRAVFEVRDLVMRCLELDVSQTLLGAASEGTW